MNVREELEVLIRARYPLLYVATWEEARVLEWVSAMQDVSTP